MTHDEFLQSLAGRFHHMIRERNPNGAPSLWSPNPAEVIGRWLAYRVASYFQRCDRAVFENVRTWHYWQRHEKEDVDWTIYHLYCGVHRHQPERSHLKTVVLSNGDGYLCEIFNSTSRTVERSEGRLIERGDSMYMQDRGQPTREHMGRIVWTPLDPAAGSSIPSLASRSDTIDEPTFGAASPSAHDYGYDFRSGGIVRREIPAVSTRTSGQDQGGAVAALVQTGSEWGNSASLDSRVARELNRLAPEVYRNAPRSGEGVLAVIDSESQQHYGGGQASSYLGCHIHGVFPSPARAIRHFNQSTGSRRGLAPGTHRGAEGRRQFFWGVLADR
jgi:hypothetical protein